MTDPAARPGAPLRAWRRPPWLAAALATVVVLACAMTSITPDPIGVFWDDGVYLLTAKALAAGDGYRYTYLPGAPPAIHYPPLFPLLLAAVLKVTPPFPDNVAVLKLLNPLLLAMGVFGTVRLAVRNLGLAPVPVAITVAISAVIAPVLVVANVLFSESLFFAALVGAIALVDAAIARGGVGRAAIAGLAVAALALVRTIGGVLLPAAFLQLWGRRRRREAFALAIVTVVLLAPWQWWVWQSSRGFPDELRGFYGPYLEWVIGGYLREPALAVQVLARNAGDLWRAFGVLFAPRLPRALQWVAAAMALASLGAGLVTLLRRASVTAAFVLLYGVVVLFWPYNPERFIWAVWPLLALLLLAAARDVGAALAHRWPPATRAATLTFALLLAGQAVYASRGLAGGWAGAPQAAMTRRIWPLVTWTAAHTSPDDIVASDAHVMVALYAGRKTIPVSMLTPTEHVRDKPLTAQARELGALTGRFHPKVLVLSDGLPQLDAIPLWAAQDGAPVIHALPAIAGGGAAFALRERQ